MSVLAHVQRLARQDKQKVDEQRREKHLPVARALRDPRQAPLIVAEARQQVALWRSKNLCSADYIEAWESLLNVPVQAAEVLEDAFSSRGRSSSRVTSRHFDHGNGSRAFTFKLFRSG